MMTSLKRVLVPVLLLALAPVLAAQRVGGAHFAGATSFRMGHFGPRAFRRGYFPAGLYAPFYDDYLSDAGYPVARQPQMILLQAPPPAAAVEPAPIPAQSLMIELQGDRYVQISGDQSSGSGMIDSPVQGKLTTRSTASPGANSPAVLIFRDGHRQEVSAYTIAGGALYANSDFATTGSWTQKIELSTLNVPETIAANNARPHPFRIPSSPNEVIVGP